MAKKLKGNITNTGYWPNSPDRNNDFNIIPSNEITMEGMNMPLVGISNTGDMRVMNPNENHKFNGDYVTEFPMNNNAIFLGRFKYANGGLVKMQPGGPNNELAKFSKQPVNTNDLRYVGSQQAVQDKTKAVVPNVQAAKKQAPAVQKEIQRVNKAIEDRNDPMVQSAADVYAIEEQEMYQPPKGFVAKQVPGTLGSMMTIYVNPQDPLDRWVDPQTVAQQKASMAMKYDADMLFNRLNPLTATGAMAFYGADNVAKGNVAAGLSEMAMASPLVGKLIHGAGHYGLNKGLISEATVPLLNKRLHQAYEVKHTAATVKGAGNNQGLPIEQPKEYVYKPEFIDSDPTRQNKEYMERVYGQLPTVPVWMQQQAGPRMMNGGDISVPDLRRQDGGDMPFGLPLKQQNIYTLPEYNQPRDSKTGEILPDPQRPNLGMDTGATEYKHTYATDEGHIDVPSVVAGQYIGDKDLDRYKLTGERFKTMNNLGSYSNFYDQIGRLGLMQEKHGGPVKRVKIKSLPRSWKSQ